MPKYRVCITQKAYTSAYVVVDARTPGEAENLALEQARSGTIEIEFEADDWDRMEVAPDETMLMDDLHISTPNQETQS